MQGSVVQPGLFFGGRQPGQRRPAARRHVLAGEEVSRPAASLLLRERALRAVPGSAEQACERLPTLPRTTPHPPTAVGPQRAGAARPLLSGPLHRLHLHRHHPALCCQDRRPRQRSARPRVHAAARRCRWRQRSRWQQRRRHGGPQAAGCLSPPGARAKLSCLLSCLIFALLLMTVGPMARRRSLHLPCVGQSSLADVLHL